MADLILKDECYEIVGICMKVHSKLGKGFKEIVYKDALEIELKAAGIPYEREKEFKVRYEGEYLPRKFRVDFWIYNAFILEAKASTLIHIDVFRDILNYLKTAGVQLGLLVNFGSERLFFKRIVCTY
jgi:GxxExxY protein